MQDALMLNLLIVAASTQNLSAELKAKRWEVPWREIAGLRNRLVHDYVGTDLNILWNIAERDVPPLKASMREALAKLE